MLIPKSFSCSDILIAFPFNTILGGLLIILLMFFLEERNIATVLAKFSVISLSTRQFQVVLSYLFNFGPFLTNFVHQIGEKTEKNSDKILLVYHFYGPSLFLNIKVFIILSTSKKFYILPKWS